MVDRSFVDMLKDHILKRRTEAEEMLSRLVAIPSISGNEGDAQREVHRIFAAMEGVASLIPINESLREDSKFASGINMPFDNRPQTRFFWEGCGGGRSLITCAHVDVVGPGNWKEAFVPRIKNDFLYGRGSVDDKAAIVSLILAVQALQENNIHLKGDFEAHFTIEEEVGMAGALAFVRQGYRADGVLVLEPTDHNIYIAHRGALQFRIEVEGKQAHLGNKRYGVNAIEQAAKIIQALVRYEDQLIDEGRGYPLFESFEYPGQVNVGIIKGGDFFSIVPDLVIMEGGVGFLPNRSILQVERELLNCINEINDQWLSQHFKLTFDGIKNEPYQMPQGHSFTNALQKTLTIFDRKPEIKGMMATCDARYYYNQGGMPSIVYGGKNAAQAHSKDEHAEIPDVLETAVEYAAFIVDWCGAL